MQVDRVLTAFYSWHEGKCGKRRHKGTGAQARSMKVLMKNENRMIYVEMT